MRSIKTISILAVLLVGCGLVSAQVHKRDFSKMESIMGVPKICLKEIAAFNFNKDCINLVSRTKSGYQQSSQHWHPPWLIFAESTSDLDNGKA